MNGTNGNRPKLELSLGQSERVKLLKNPIVGSSQYGDYFLYPVEVNGEERSFFATPEIHQQISEMKLGPGDTIILRKLAQQNGKKVGAKWVLEVQQRQEQKSETMGSELKALMLSSLRDAVEITHAIQGIPWRSEDIQKIGVAMYLSSSRKL
jgi:hypothetical protein